MSAPVSSSTPSALSGQAGSGTALSGAALSGAALSGAALSGAVQCRLCGSSRIAPRYAVDGYSIFKCAECDVEFIAALPEETFDLQSEAFDDAGFSNSANAGVQRYWKNEVAEIHRLGYSGGRVLDVGCNDGLFLSLFPSAWEKHGIELAPGVARRAAERGITVHSQPVESLAFAPASFDVITMYMIIEHLSDPVATVQKLAAWLRPNGLLVVLTGATDTLKARRARAKWFMYTPPVHQFFFSSASLARLLQKGGFETLRKKYTYGGVTGFKASPFRQMAHAVGLAAAYTPLNQLPLYDCLFLYARKRESLP